MEPVLTPEEMTAADRRAIASGTPFEVLMDRAGHAVAWAVRRRLGRTYGARIVVACGRGNNGGDGRVAARVLRGWGARVDVVEVDQAIDLVLLDRVVGRADLVVDAMYGTGFRGELNDGARAVCESFRGFRGPVLAVDIPSGVDGLTGEVRGASVRADETVSFAAAKPGLLFEPGRTHAGAVHVVDIGIATTSSDAPVKTFVTTHDDVAGWLARRTERVHKWSAGCFVIGGSGGMTGAPMLASHAAMRAGAGIVWCGVPGREAVAHASGTEVIARALPADGDGTLAREAADAVLAEVGRFRAVAVGPGLGRNDATAEAVRRLVSGVPGPMVVDADALHALAGHLDLLGGRSAVLTPHGGEYEALVGHAPAPDRLAAARALASATGAVVLLKGPGTVVADPEGRAAICPLGGSWLASAGTGDVLTGIVAAFLARAMPPFEAAAAAAFVHAAAADRAGHTGLVAGDLVSAIPATLAAIDGTATVGR